MLHIRDGTIKKSSNKCAAADQSKRAVLLLDSIT